MPEQIPNPYGLVLYKSDLRLLKAPNWLNDNCINFYLNHLQREEYKHRPDFLFMDPTVVSCMMVQCEGKERNKERSIEWIMKGCHHWCLFGVFSYVVPDDEELRELGEGINVSSMSYVFIPVNDRLELTAGCMHWWVGGRTRLSVVKCMLYAMEQCPHMNPQIAPLCHWLWWWY